MEKILQIALIAGGISGEREVSLKGALAVEQALDPCRFAVRRYDPAKDLAALVQDAGQIDFAFIMLHGLYGEDGTVQGFLELLKIPYQGSGVLGSATAIDKNFSKKLYQAAGLPVADWQIIERQQHADIPALAAEFGLPVVVKPVREGSSLGLTLAQSEAELARGIATGLHHDRAVMVERYIRGRELTVGVLGNRELTALPVIEIIPGEGFSFFDYEAKYRPGATEEICPAAIADTLRRQVQEYAVRAHRALHLRGYSRTDFVVAEDDSVYLLETNTIPGMTETSLLPQAAQAHGLSFSALLEKLIELGMEEK